MSLDDMESKYKELSLYDAFEKSYAPRIIELAVSLKTNMPIDIKIETLTNVIRIFDEFRAKAYLRGSFYARYFSKDWEHCYNSRSPDFCYIDRFKKELDDLKLNYTRLKQDEVQKSKELVDLDSRIIKALKSNPGILQKDIYALFDPVVKADVQERLYFWEKEGKIKREKTGSTYKVFTV